MAFSISAYKITSIEIGNNYKENFDKKKIDLVLISFLFNRFKQLLYIPIKSKNDVLFE